MESTTTVDMNIESAAGGGIFTIIWLAFTILMIVSMWKIFTKAGKPGWASIIPFYNLFVMLEIAGKPGWWILLILFVPIANIIFLIMMIAGIAANFGKGIGYVLGFIFLPIIFFPMLAFGSAQYKPVAPAAPSAS